MYELVAAVDGRTQVVDRDGKAVTTGPVADLIASLRQARAAEELAAARQRSLVQQLRAAGVSWAIVGECLGVTRVAAWKRYGDDTLL